MFTEYEIILCEDDLDSFSVFATCPYCQNRKNVTDYFSKDKVEMICEIGSVDIMCDICHNVFGGDIDFTQYGCEHENV